MATYRGYLPMLASWPAAQPLIDDLRRQLPTAVDGQVDTAASHALLYRPDGQPAAYGRLQADGRIDSLCLAAGSPIADAGAVLLGYLAELAAERGIGQLHIHPPDGWRHLLRQLDPDAHRHGHDRALATAAIQQHWRLAGVTEARLGETPMHWELLTAAEYAEIILCMSRQATRSLRLFSPSLAHPLFDHAALADAVSALARRSRYSEIRILLTDPRPLVQRGHALLDLYRRLPTRVPIRRLPYPADELNAAALLLADDCGLALQPKADDDSAWACFNDRPRVRAVQDVFEHLWHRSVTDAELRDVAL